MPMYFKDQIFSGIWQERYSSLQPALYFTNSLHMKWSRVVQYNIKSKSKNGLASY